MYDSGVQRSELVNLILSRTDYDTVPAEDMQKYQKFVQAACDLVLFCCPEYIRRPSKPPQLTAGR